MYPCFTENCTFEGEKLKRHFISKQYKIPKGQAKLYETYFRHTSNYINKLTKDISTMYQTCKLSFDRINSHLAYIYQLKRQSPEYIRAYDKSKDLTSIFKSELYSSEKDIPHTPETTLTHQNKKWITQKHRLQP